MKKIILKYNPRLGNNQMPAIVKLALELNCTIENSFSDDKTKIIIITVSGDQKALFQMNERLVRYASIDRKVA